MSILSRLIRPSLQTFTVERVWKYPDRTTHYHKLGYVRATTQADAVKIAQRIIPNAALRITPAS